MISVETSNFSAKFSFNDNSFEIYFWIGFQA
jgi:hypothetical protein